MKTLLKNGTIVDGSGGKPYVSDVLIENDKITKIAKDIDAADAEVIDCTGLTRCPGLHRRAQPQRFLLRLRRR